jgi:hypothetical protein
MKVARKKVGDLAHGKGGGAQSSSILRATARHFFFQENVFRANLISAVSSVVMD